jgi:hypothetical protein
LLIERQNRLLETVEPDFALAWCALDHPQIQRFQLDFGGRCELNAVRHTCAGAG